MFNNVKINRLFFFIYGKKKIIFLKFNIMLIIICIHVTHIYIYIYLYIIEKIAFISIPNTENIYQYLINNK